MNPLGSEEIRDVLAVAVQEFEAVGMVRLDSLADVNIPEETSVLTYFNTVFICNCSKS
jgi:hypothetical protein